MIWGRLTDHRMPGDDCRISRACFVHPRVEPEVAFLMRKDLSGTITMLDALDAVEAVAPALEIIDSCYENFASLSPTWWPATARLRRWSSGRGIHPRSHSTIGPGALCINGGAQVYGSTAAILGDPVRALIAAARLAALDGEKIEAGHIVMAGGARGAIALEIEMHVQQEIERLGRVVHNRRLVVHNRRLIDAIVSSWLRPIALAVCESGYP